MPENRHTTGSKTFKTVVGLLIMFLKGDKSNGGCKLIFFWWRDVDAFITACTVVQAVV